MRGLRLVKFLLALPVAEVSGHGYVTNIVVNGVSYPGWDITSYPYETDPPIVAAWGTPNTAEGFIAPDAYQTPDIICHLDATNAKGYVTVAAGDSIFLQWTPWPSSHHGPIIDYLANCGSSCVTVDKTTLQFFKIDGVGLVSDSSPPGTWGDDEMIANNNGWLVKIPPTIAPGNYVLRHELIALHGGENVDGAQNYMQCFNLQITGSGTTTPSGTLGENLYHSADPGILVNIYTSLSTYIIPGPTLYSGAVSVAQTSSAITSWGNATVSGGGATSTTSRSSSASVKTTTTTTTTSGTTFSTTTKSTATTTTTSSGRGASTSTQTLYGQCGGGGYTGPTVCVASATCSTANSYYAQCIPTST